MRLTPDQQAHEARIETTRQSLVAAADRGERQRLSCEFYRLLKERDPELVRAMEEELLDKAGL